MAKITYKCNKCNYSIQKIRNTLVGQQLICPNCGDEELVRQLPNISGLNITEIVDVRTNKKCITDQKEVLKNRSEDHYWSVEVPRFVQSGIYSVETMLENGWVYLDEKEQMRIHTKPPSRR